MTPTMSSMHQHLICILLYGDYTHLAQRCLSGLLANTDHANLQARVRIGLNQVSQATYQYVCNLAARFDWSVVQCKANALKYPMMRQLFFETEAGLNGYDYVIWFDDDSYCGDARWLPTVYALMEDADMVGALYEAHLKGNQHLWIRNQPWYNGKPVHAGDAFPFAVGGWWAIRTEILSAFNWPPVNIRHRGGDIMLGQLLRQHDFRLRAHHDYVRVNADEQGREEAAPRRGHDETAVGEL